MKIREGYKVREIAGEYIIVNQGSAGADFTRVISLNSSAKLLFESFSGREFSLEDAAAVLVEKYGIDSDRALADAAVWAEGMINAGVAE